MRVSIGWACLVLGCIEPQFHSGLPVSEPPRVFAPESQIPVLPPRVDTGIPTATASMYAHTSTDLYIVDAKTLEVQWVGEFRGRGGGRMTLTDLAIDFDGNLYGVGFGALYRVHPETAATTPACALPVPNPVGLAFTANGDLYVGGDNVYRTDPRDCSSEALATFSSHQTSGDLVPLPDGYLYWTVTAGTSDRLLQVDPSTGLITDAAAMNASSVWGVGYDDGTLYGFTAGGAIVAVNPETGTAEEVANPGLSWWGATTNPVAWKY